MDNYWKENYSMNALFNTKALFFFHKTGVDYYVHNFSHELRRSGVQVVATELPASWTFMGSLGKIFFSLNRMLGLDYPAFQKSAGDKWSQKLSSPALPSKYDLYNEMTLNLMQEIQAGSAVQLLRSFFHQLPRLSASSVRRNGE